MARSHQPGQAVFRSVLPADVDWKPFSAFPPAVRLSYITSVELAAGDSRSQL